MFFSVEGERLSGLQILLIVIPRSAPREAHLTAGTALCDGHEIIVNSGGRRTPSLPAPRESLVGFDPAILPRLIVPRQYARLQPLLHGVVACVALFADVAPAGALVLHDAFFGLGEGAAGQPLLFQGSPEGDGDAAEAPEPWATPWPRQTDID